jgi:ABC-2 type transport system permease protein
VRILRLLAVFVRLGALGELAYRANFFIQAFESVVNAGSVLATVGVVFARTERLGDWHPWQLVALIGVYFIVLGLINLVLDPSLSKFMEGVQQGTFDFTLIKPEDAQLLASVSEFRLWQLIDVGLGAGILGFALGRMGERVSAAQGVSFACALLCGLTIVYSFWIMLATLAFWLIKIENILMIFWSMYTAGRWPVGIYPGWLRFMLTLVVPIAFAVTVPAQAITGRLEPSTLGLAAVLALGMSVSARWFWLQGLRRYAGASA